LVGGPGFKAFVMSVLFCSVGVTRNIKEIQPRINLISRLLLLKLRQELLIIIHLHINLLRLYLLLLSHYKLNCLVPRFTRLRLKLRFLSVLNSQRICSFRLRVILILLLRLNEMDGGIVGLIL